MYNLFHPADPLTCRVEPLLSAPFSSVPPVNVSRYQTYPMGDGACYSLIEFIQGNTGLFADGGLGPLSSATSSTMQRHLPPLQRRLSEESIISGVVDAQQLHTINILKPKWWGGRRIGRIVPKEICIESRSSPMINLSQTTRCIVQKAYPISPPIACLISFTPAIGSLPMSSVLFCGN